MSTTAKTQPVGRAAAMARPRAEWRVIAVLAVLLLGAALRVYRLGSQPLWIDEAASLHLARLPVARLWSWTHPVDRGNPPLYYTVLHFWIRLGYDETHLRLLSALFSLLTIPVAYLLGRTIANRRLGLIVAVLFATSPLQIRYAQEARTYALLGLAATTAMWGVASILRDATSRLEIGEGHATRDADRVGSPRLGWAAYVVGSGVALLAHDTALPLVLAANVVVLGWWWARGRRPAGLLRRWTFAQAVVVAVWAAWLPAVLGQAEALMSNFWVPKPTAHAVLVVARDVALPETLDPPLLGQWRLTMYGFGAVLVILLAAGAWRLRRTPRWIGFATAFLLLPPVAELAASMVWQPVLLARTLIWVTVPLYLLVAAGCLLLARRPTALVAALAALALVHGWGLRNYYVVSQKEAWDKAAHYVSERGQPGDVILFTANVGQAPFDYYFSAVGNFPEHGVPDDLSPLGWNEVPVQPSDVPAVERLASRYRRVWLVYSHAQFDDPDNLVPQALHVVADVEQATRFHDVEVRLYRVGEPAG